MGKKLLGNLSTGSVIVGLLAGVAISHVFHSTVEKTWGAIPLVNKIPEY